MAAQEDLELTSSYRYNKIYSYVQNNSLWKEPESQLNSYSTQRIKRPHQDEYARQRHGLTKSPTPGGYQPLGRVLLPEEQRGLHPTSGTPTFGICTRDTNSQNISLWKSMGLKQRTIELQEMEMLRLQGSLLTVPRKSMQNQQFEKRLDHMQRRFVC